uniref:Uncharacterized protein n=1 Tax=Rhizophora mucronata TaxID=61149 RepID=A0A2P2NJV0_RHIMU
MKCASIQISHATVYTQG